RAPRRRRGRLAFRSAPRLATRTLHGRTTPPRGARCNLLVLRERRLGRGLSGRLLGTTMKAVHESIGDRLLWCVLAPALVLPVVIVIRGGVRRGIVAPFHGQSGDGLGDYGVVPDFSLTERSGA